MASNQQSAINNQPSAIISDPLLMGSDPAPGLVAVEHQEQPGQDQMILFWREGESRRQTSEPFTPFIWIAREELLEGPVKDAVVTTLSGDAPFRWKVSFPTWKACQKAKAWLAKTSGVTAGNPQAPYFLLGDPIQQYLLQSGRTLFKGMRFEDVRRMQVDIECFTTRGFEFCNPERDGDRIIAIALGDSSGWREVLSGAELDEKKLLEAFVARVHERDPDVLEGHNIFNFDLPYLAARAKRHGVKLALGRTGQAPDSRPSRFNIGERTVAYTRFEIFGRHVMDTYFMVQAYDITHRVLESYGLKNVARHFGISPADRVYLKGGDISSEFEKNPARLMQYALHDIEETEALSRLLSQSEPPRRS